MWEYGKFRINEATLPSDILIDELGIYYIKSDGGYLLKDFTIDDWMHVDNEDKCGWCKSIEEAKARIYAYYTKQGKMLGGE